MAEAFDNRDHGAGITFVRAAPRDAVKQKVEDGDDVTLKIGDEHILVRDARLIAPGRYSGRIYGFEPSHQTEFGGYHLEQDVEFTESQVYTCG